MNQVTIFRVLIVTSIVLAIAGGAGDALFPGLVPEALNEAYEAHAAAEEPGLTYLLAMGGLVLILFIGIVAGTAGLWLFKAWGRQLSLWVSVLGMLIYPFLGPVVCSGWSTMFTETSTALWSAALAMAYFADINVRFAVPSARETARPDAVA